MILLRWLGRMLFDLVVFAIVNRAPVMAVAVLALLGLGIVIVAVKVTAPFIYTLF